MEEVHGRSLGTVQSSPRYTHLPQLPSRRLQPGPRRRPIRYLARLMSSAHVCQPAGGSPRSGKPVHPREKCPAHFVSRLPRLKRKVESCIWAWGGRSVKLDGPVVTWANLTGWEHGQADLIGVRWAQLRTSAHAIPSQFCK